MAKLTGFIFQDGYLEPLAKLSDQELGRLVRALAKYHMTGEEQELAGRESIAYDFIKADIDRIEQDYATKCETNRNNRLTTVNDRQRSSTTVNESKRSRTNGNETAQVIVIEKNSKEKEKENNNENTKTRAREEKTPPGFDRFWESYPRKTAKQEAIKAFEKLKPDAMLIETMVKAVERQKQSAQWQEDGGRYIPHPATWINQRRWEDVLPAKGPEKLKVVNAAKYDQREYHESDFEENDAALLREAAMM